MKLFSLFLILFLGLTNQNSFAKPTMSFVDLISTPSLSSPRLSPDGKKMLFVLTVPDWEENTTTSHIWLVDVETKAILQLTNGPTSEGFPRWSPNSKSIAFLSKRNRETSTQIYKISLSGGEAFRVSDHPTSIVDFSWSNDGTEIYFLASDDKSNAEKAKLEEKDDVYTFDENFSYCHLWKLNVLNYTSTKITDGKYSLRDFDLSADNKKIIFQKALSPRGDDSHSSEVWIMDSNGDNQVRLTDNNSSEFGLQLSPNGKQIIFLSWSDGKGGVYNEDNLFIMNSDGKNLHELLTDFDHQINAARWSSDGRNIFFIANLGVKNELFKLNVKSGKIIQETDGEHTIRNWHYSPKSKSHVISLRDNFNNGDFYLLSNKNDSKPERLTAIFDYLKQKFDLPKQKKITWKGVDGTEIEGLLTYPNNYVPGHKYALSVQIHGGPMRSDQYGIFKSASYIPVFAAKGYFVLQPNYRGSVGYGDAFVRDMVGHYFNNSHLDVMAGVDYVIAQGLVDEDRMIIMGWSAGGHMTNKIITFTNRFKAASSGAGASNWISMYGQTDIRLLRDNWFGGSPWSKDAPIDVYWDNSPLKDVWKVKTPTLVLVGEDDSRVPMPQSVEFYRAMKANGVDTHLYVAPRAKHGWRELHHRLFKMNVEMDWFEKFARQRNFIWEEYPGEKSTEEKPENREETEEPEE